ncbi:hypothetical protein [Bradyrhizobium sp. NBAIM01]|uniref:hypothetical protein n=1 Tax=Bradyrhizobium sp. NBAIM01 TaxID=2793818 RepID=UPI001CD6B6D2|nr:hypothetical protein [Bradyrhizobium sp. NBAIM01]MCA1510250.1 hypothetical protein [Bradyrhizobium sp. NBAIM01]
MTQPVTINIAPSTQPQTIAVQLEPRPTAWTDLALYAPTLPGVVVAVLGLWVAHRFAQIRDRRKEVLELKELAKSSLVEATEACTAAWLDAADDDRPAKLMAAKRKLQTFGITATDLKRKTKQGVATHLRHLFFDCPLAIDIVNDVGRLRNLATNDPFDDLEREPDRDKAEDISALTTEILARIDLLFHQLYD